MKYTDTLSSFAPSTPNLVRLPTISVGYTRSSKIFSWTSVNVRERGRFCLTRDVRVGLARVRRWATKTTCLSENFFSNSRVNLYYIYISKLDLDDNRQDRGFDRRCSPGMNLSEGLELGNGDKDYDSFFATFDVDLPGCTDLQWPQLVLELGHV